MTLQRGMDDLDDLSRHGEFGFAVEDTNMDLNNAFVLQTATQECPSLLLHLWRKESPQKALGLIRKMKREAKTNRLAEEVVFTYLYLNDPAGALNYMRYNEFTNPRIKYLEKMIEISAKTEEPIEALFPLIHECLERKFVKSVLAYLVDRIMEEHPGSFREVLREYMNRLEGVFTDTYVYRLTYDEAKYLYKTTPYKTRFLPRMVHSNPYIKLKYYREYAGIYGLHRNDIIFILTHCWREWAFRIAFENKWIDKSMRPVIERRFMGEPLIINRTGKWERAPDKSGISFLRNDIFRE